jgi:hypothetical protein
MTDISHLDADSLEGKISSEDLERLRKHKP